MMESYHETKELVVAAEGNTNRPEPNEEDVTMRRMIQTVHGSLVNMGQALKCPLCLSTLKNPVVLPCIHAFCRTCASSALSSTVSSTTACCPVCKVAATKRSLVDSPHLAQLARAYKRTLQSFGLLPAVSFPPTHNNNKTSSNTSTTPPHPVILAMTQMDPNEEDEDAEHVATSSVYVSHKAKSKHVSLAQVHQHLQVSRAIHRGLVSEQSCSSNHDKNHPKKDPNHWLLQQQQHVIDMDERALVRAAVAQTKLNKRSNAANNENDNNNDVSSSVLPQPQLASSAAPTHRMGPDGSCPEKDRPLFPSETSTASARSNTTDQQHVNTQSQDETALYERSMQEARESEVADRSLEWNLQEEDDNNEAPFESDSSTHPVMSTHAIPSFETKVTTSTNDDPTNHTRMKPLTLPHVETEATAMDIESTTVRLATHPLGKESATKIDTIPRQDIETMASPPFFQLPNSPTLSLYKAATLLKEIQTASRDDGTTLDHHPDMTHNTTRPTRELEQNNRSVSFAETTILPTNNSTSTEERQTILSQGNILPSTHVEESIHQNNANIPMESSKASVAKTTLSDVPAVLGMDHATLVPTLLVTTPKPHHMETNFDVHESDEESLHEDHGILPSQSCIEKNAASESKVNSLLEVESTTHVPTETVSPKEHMMTDVAPLNNDQECTSSKDHAIMEKENDGANSASVSEEVKLVLEVGMVVNVEARHWPGINKPGGVARITRVIRDNTRPTIIQYNVAYILGGTEKRVDGTFVSVLNEMNANTTPEEQDSTTCTPSSRRPRSRRSSVENKENWTIPASPPPKRNDRIEKGLAHHRGNLQSHETNTNKASNKKQTTTTKNKKRSSKNNDSHAQPKHKKAKKGTKQRSTPNTSTTVEPMAIDNKTPEKEALKPVMVRKSDVEYCQLADEQYKRLLGITQGEGEGKDAPIHIVMSSLSDHDANLVKILCAELKEAGRAPVKIMKDFHPAKTTICITAPVPFSRDETIEGKMVVSQLRTLKSMRAALAGIPLVTPAWVTACIKESTLVAPQGVMCIRSLPVKDSQWMDERVSSHNHTAHCGVARYAAEAGSGNALLKDVVVYMPGSWWSGPQHQTKRRDIQILLRETGATYVTSQSSFSKHMTRRASAHNECSLFVVIGNETESASNDESTNVTNDIAPWTATLLQHVQKGVPLLAVNPNWLFDCISCGSLLPSDSYEPCQLKEVWSLSCTRRKEATNSSA